MRIQRAAGCRPLDSTHQLQLRHGQTYLLGQSSEQRRCVQITCHQGLMLMQWLIALHLVRHPVGTEARLVALFQLLVMQFGIRRSDGYLLPFTIPHSRLAELIGATRSTVTRQINALRQQSELQLWEDGAVLFSDRLIEQKPPPCLLSNPECVSQMAKYRHLYG